MRLRIVYLFFIISFFNFYSCSLDKNLNGSNYQGETETDEPEAMLRWEYNRVKDPKTGLVPKQNLVDAYNDFQRRQVYQTEAAVTGINWTERGPYNIGGRTRAIIFDKKDVTNKTVWAASVGGGLFKCTDIDATTPTWTKTNDFFSNLAITCIAQNPTYPDTMYFGTGETFGNADGIAGAGIWRSVDNGVNWTQLSATTGFLGVSRLAVSSTGVIYASLASHFFAGGTGGLYKSTDGGVTFTPFLTTSTTPACGSNTGRDVKIAANGDIYYSCNAQVWKYKKLTSTWSNITPAGTFQRIEIACAPSDSNYVYILCQGAGITLGGFYTSTNSGTSWTSNTLPLIYDQNTTNNQEFTRGQAWYDLSIAVQPDTATIVYLGAIDYVKSKDAGATYKQITAWSLFNMPGAANLGSNQVMHSDHHALVFKPGNTSYALFGCDGGLYKSTNMRNTWPTQPTVATINTNFSVTEFYSCAIANTASSSNLLGGAQDNGSIKINAPGVASGTAVSGGDGCYVFIDQNNSNNQITSYVYNNFYMSTNATTFNTLTGSNNTGSFVNPSDIDGTNDILYSYAGTSTLARWTNVFGAVSRTNLTVSGVGTITHIKVSSNNPTTIYLGNSSGSVYRITGANTATSPITPTLLNASSFSGNISCIDVRKCTAATDDTILVTQSSYNLSNSVLVTVNGTSGTPTWTNIDNTASLPNIPVNGCLFAPTSLSKEVLLATEMGVYTCDNIYAGTPVWGQSVTGLANVRVNMLHMRSADSVIVAASFGRGLFTTDKYTSPVASFAADKTATYINGVVTFTDGSLGANSWAWDFDNNGSIDATTQNPTWSFGMSGYKTVKLTINGSYSKTMTNYIQVLPNNGVPYTTAQGGDFESNASDFGATLINGTSWERGNSVVAGKSGVQSGSNAWVTGLTATAYSDNNETYLYTPNFNLYGTTTDSIKFYLKNAFEIGYDGVRVEYSTDYGNTWTPLSTTTAANWYDYANSSATTAFPLNQAYFNSNRTTYTLVKYPITALAGNKSVAFRFAFKSDVNTNAAGCAVDNFEITSTVTTTANYFIETTALSKSENFGPSETDTFYSANGKIIAILKNNSTHDYGLTTVTIDNAGTGDINYSTNTAASKRLFQKTITIVPTTNNTSGNYTATLYYDASELSGWRSVTGNGFTNANILKCPTNIASGTIANGVYGTGTTKASYGASDSSITATFATGFSGFGSGADITILPVDLISFNAIKNNNDVNLDWKTASEINNSGFDIERSFDGRSWTKISFVKGFGNSAIQHNYQFIDLNAFEYAGTIYYRLKQIDYNGVFKYSNIKLVKNTPIAETVNLSPQPSKGILQVQTSLTKGFSYQVLSAEGRILAQGSSKSNQTSIDLSTIPAGTYYLKISDNQQTLSTKSFIKVD